MSQIKTLNGVQYTLPQLNDTNWGANTGNVLTQYIAAIADCTLQLSGGSFTLTADADFGGNFGLKALYLKSETANIATSGVIRLASADTIGWRNNANGANVSLSKDTSDNLLWGGTKVIISGAIVNADINASAAIAYSKLSLSASIVNADIASGAAIAYSKLALTGAILNADLAGSIAATKLAALTVSRAVATDGSGFLSASAVTATELGYVSGVTSAIQTQVNTKAADTAVVHNTGDENVAGVKTFTTNNPVQAQHGSVDDTTFTSLTIMGGDSTARVALKSYTATGITTAKKIFDLAQYGNLLLVNVNNGTAQATDLIWAAFGGTVTVISAFTGTGSPAARTYSISTGDLRVAMGSGTYTANVFAIEMRGR